MEFIVVPVETTSLEIARDVKMLQRQNAEYTNVAKKGEWNFADIVNYFHVNCIIQKIRRFIRQLFLTGKEIKIRVSEFKGVTCMRKGEILEQAREINDVKKWLDEIIAEYLQKHVEEVR